MITIIGAKNCGKCVTTANVLKEKGLEYHYKLFENLNEEEKVIVLDRAKEKGIVSFPIILNEEEVITLKEVT